MKRSHFFKLLKNYSIRKQMLIGFLSIVLLVGFMGGVAYVESTKINNEVDFMFNEVVPKRDAISDMRTELMLQIRATEEYATDFLTEEEAGNEIDEIEISVQEKLSRLEKPRSSGEGILTKKVITKLNATINDAQRLRNEIFRIKGEEVKRAARSEKGVMSEGVREKLEEFDAVVERIGEVTETIVEMSNSSENVSRSQILQFVKVGQQVNLIVFILVVILSLSVSIIVSGLISNAITIARDVAIGVSKGNMNIKIDTSGSNEIAELLQAIDEMRASLKIIMRDYKKAFKTKG